MLRALALSVVETAQLVLRALDHGLDPVRRRELRKRKGQSVFAAKVRETITRLP